LIKTELFGHERDDSTKREGLSEEAAGARIEAFVRYLDSIQERSGD
jgi:hypothetical protein